MNIVTDRDGGRVWHVVLGSELEAAGHGVGWRATEATGPALPGSVGLLLWLERNLSADAARSWGSFLAPAPLPGSPAFADADYTIDLSSGAPSQSCLRLRFDAIGETGCMAALLEGRSPRVEVRRYPENRVVAQGTPSLEGADTIAGQCGLITRLAIDLMVRAVAAVPYPATEPAPAQDGSPVQVVRHVRRRLVGAALRAVYARCCFSPHWRIGWRFVQERDVWSSLDLSGAAWQPLANPACRFLADPFPFCHAGAIYVFAEDFDHRVGKGIISYVPFGPDGPIGPAQPVLEERWHLSYPFLIEHAGTVWMIPEASASGQVAAYRGDPFPTRWVREAVLLDGFPGTDATIVWHGERFWMFVTGARGPEFSDTLSLFYADNLLGPWHPHDLNPVLIDAGSARSAGNLVERAGRLWRPVQDCRGGYGRGIGLARIDALNERTFRQTVVNRLYPGPAWAGRRLHTLNRAGRLECIDGSANEVRLLAGRRGSRSPRGSTLPRLMMGET